MTILIWWCPWICVQACMPWLKDVRRWYSADKVASIPYREPSSALNVAYHSSAIIFLQNIFLEWTYNRGFVIWECQSYRTTSLWQPVIMFQQAIIPDLSSCISRKRSENYIFILLQAPWCIAVIHQVAGAHSTPGWSCGCTYTAKTIKPWLECECCLSIHWGSAYGHTNCTACYECLIIKPSSSSF